MEILVLRPEEAVYSHGKSTPFGGLFIKITNYYEIWTKN